MDVAKDILDFEHDEDSEVMCDVVSCSSNNRGWCKDWRDCKSNEVDSMRDSRCDTCNCAMHDCQYCSVNGFHEEVD